jgi:peptide/nickel transport system substrate-binding protein
MFFLGYGNSMFDASLALDRLKFDQAKGETDYNNPETEALLNAATSNMNPEERIEQYQKAQELIAEDRPQIYLFQVESIYGKNDRIDYAPRVDEMFYVDEITLK